MNKITTFLTVAALGAGLNATAQTVIDENFASTSGTALPAGWTQIKKGATGWKSASGKLGFTNGWAVPNVRDRYVVVDDWNNNEVNDTVSLVTPPLNLTGITGAVLTYDYYFVGAAYGSAGPTEKAFVNISTDGGATWNVADTLVGDPAGWQYAVVNLSAYDNMNNVQVAFTYHDGGDPARKLVGVALDNIRVAVPQAVEARLVSMTPEVETPKSYEIGGANLSLGGKVYNYGTNAINSFTVKYKLAGGSVTSDVINGVNIPPYGSADFTSPTALVMPSTNGNYPLEMWIELPGDTKADNDSANTAVTSVSFKPAKKIFVEEGTGTWCGWCPRGSVYMDSVFHTYGSNFSLVAVHNNDPMKNTTYDNFIGGLVGGYPSLVVDRSPEVLDPSDLIDVYNAKKDDFGFAEITMADQGAGSFNFSAKVSVKPAIDLNGDYRLALVLTEDDVTGTGSSWGQANYYSYQYNNIPLYGAGFAWHTEPGTVPAEKMNYDFVGRAIIPSPTGAAGSLPATMTAGTTYDYTFTTTIPEPYKRNKMRAIAILIRNSDGAVLNSNNMNVPLGISNVSAGVADMLVYPNPATDKATVDFTISENSTVKVDVYDAMGRIVSTISEQSYNKGSHKVVINTATLPAGVYSIKMQTSTGSISHQLTVVK